MSSSNDIYNSTAPLLGSGYHDMVQNGMGYRHAGDTRYYGLILVHGLFAAFAFLILTPAALVCARFLLHGPNPRRAMWGHIGFQVASLVCLTITFVAGFSAVGKENWGKNPHHIIGAVVYGGMLFNALFGIFVRWRTLAKVRKSKGLHQMLHQWFGRALFLLGLAQIPIGLYVYGSPIALFICFAVVVFIFVCCWFLCEYLRVRGWFHHGILWGRGDEESRPSMSEEHQYNRQSSLDNQQKATGHLEAPLPTPTTPASPKKSRWSKLSWFARRRSGNTPNLPPWADQDSSYPTSRAPSASPAIGGLRPPPNTTNAPPVPSIPSHVMNEKTGVEENISSPSETSIHRDSMDRFPATLRDNVFRNSTTLGGADPSQPLLQMPNPKEYQQEDLPRAPYPENRGAFPQGNYGDVSAYVETDTGFAAAPVEGPAPTGPLPSRPAAVARLPTSREEAANTTSSREEAALVRAASSRHPNVAVQVEFDATDKTYKVRRLRSDEAEAEIQDRETRRHRPHHSYSGAVGVGSAAAEGLANVEEERKRRNRERAEAAKEKEMKLERENSQRREMQQQSPQQQPYPQRTEPPPEPRFQQSYEQSRSQNQTLGLGLGIPRSDSIDPETGGFWEGGPESISGQSSTIAQNAGGLLGPQAGRGAGYAPPSPPLPPMPARPSIPPSHAARERQKSVPEKRDRSRSVSKEQQRQDYALQQVQLRYQEQQRVAAEEKRQHQQQENRQQLADPLAGNPRQGLTAASPLFGLSPLPSNPHLVSNPQQNPTLQKPENPALKSPRAGSAGPGSSENSEMEQEIVKEQRRRRRRERSEGGSTGVGSGSGVSARGWFESGDTEYY